MRNGNVSLSRILELGSSGTLSYTSPAVEQKTYSRYFIISKCCKWPPKSVTIMITRDQKDLNGSQKFHPRKKTQNLNLLLNAHFS